MGVNLRFRVQIGGEGSGGEHTYMSGAFGAVERECRALKLERHGRLVGCRGMVRALEELVAVGVGVGLDSPASGVRKGRVRVVDCEVHAARREGG